MFPKKNNTSHLGQSTKSARKSNGTNGEVNFSQANISFLRFITMPDTANPNEYQLGKETFKTESGHIGEHVEHYGYDEAHEVGLGIRMNSFVVSTYTLILL